MKKVKFNFIDICILLLVVVLVAGAVYYVNGTGRLATKSNTDNNVVFSVQLTQVDETFLSMVSEGDFVRFGNYEAGEENSGKIIGISSGQAVKHVTDNVNGGYKNSVIEDKYDMVITIQSSGVLSARDLKIGSTIIRTGEVFYGKSVNLELKKAYKIEGYVIDVDYNK